MADLIPGADALAVANFGDAPVGSPRWWLAVLSQRLERRRPKLDEYESYFNGEHPLFFATPKFREAFGELFEEFADNWCQVVVEAAAERMQIDGFRIGDSDEADAGFWDDVWQRNGLDAESSIAFLEAIKLGEALAIVEPGDEYPRVTIEHPSQVIVAYDPGDRRQRNAALKKWQDDDGVVYATVYLPDGVWRFRTKRPVATIGAYGADWIDRDDAVGSYVRNPLGVVPVVAIRNRRGLLQPGVSDLEQVIPLQNAINKLANDLIVASEFEAFRQRLLTGVEIPRYPEGHEKAGEPMHEIFMSAVSRLLVVEEPDAKAQEFGAADLTNAVKAVEMFVQHLAAQTRTPPHYLLGQVANISGDALKSAETGLVSKVRGKQRFMGQDVEDLVEVTLLAQGDTERARAKKDVVWRNPEHRSEAELADAALKLREIGVPTEGLWEYIGASQTTIARWRRMRDEQLNEELAQVLMGTRVNDQGLADEPPEAQANAAPTEAMSDGR